MSDKTKQLFREDGSFEFWYPATIEKGSDGKKWISGIASTYDEDLQGERIKQEGLDLSYFLKRGFFNDDHSKETGAKVGIPVEASLTKKGLWTKGYLLDTKRATEIAELANALSKAGGDRKLGFSVEGKVLKRDDDNPRIITKAWIKDIAITASPINPNTFMDIAKSFAAGVEVLVTGETEEEALGKGKAVKKDDDKLADLEEATKQVVSQTDVEREDAEEAAKEALSDHKPKKDLEKELPDVPVAKKVGKSENSEPLVTIEFTEDGDVVIKGLKKIKVPEDPAIVPTVCDKCKKGDCEHVNKPAGKGENDSYKVGVLHVEEPLKNSPVKDGKTEVDHDVPGKVKKGGEVCFNDCKAPVVGKFEGSHVCEDCMNHYSKLAQRGNGGNKVKDEDGRKFSQMENAKFSIPETDLVKGFKKIHEVGGERQHGDKKVPAHCTTYSHHSGHHIMVVGKDGAFSVVHSHKGKDGKAENLAGLMFIDDPVKRKKAKEDADEHLKAFGIKHKFTDKEALLGKALVIANDDSHVCELCKSSIEQGNLFMIQQGHTICDFDCIEKALVTGYQFGVTDQVGGAALRVQSLEGAQKDLSYGGHVLKTTDVKEVKFDTARANGGTTQVTLKDAVDFLMARGLPQDMADRILVLMIKNNGQIPKVSKS